MLRIVSVFTTIILARLLQPTAFGQVALAQVVLSIVGLFATLGLPTAVIQTTLNRDRVAFSALTVNVIAGVVVSGLIIAIAPWLGFLLGDKEVVPVLQVLSLSIAIGGTTRVPEALIQKELLFGRLSVMGVLTEFVNIGVSIGLAWLGWGVWSLVYGSLAAAVANAVIAWLFLPYLRWVRPANWDPELLKQISGYGWRIVGSASVYTLYSYTDGYVVGRVLGTESLGFYSRAMDLTSKTVDSINRIIGVVLFPSYAQVQDDKERLGRAYLKGLRMISLLTIPIAGGLFAVSEELIVVLLGANWSPAVAPLKVLTFMSLLKPISSTTSALFNSTGFPGFNMRAGVVVMIALLAGVFAFLTWGAVGVALAVVFAHAVGLAYNVHQVQTILPGTVVKMAQAVSPAFFSCVAMVLGVLGIRAIIILVNSTSLTVPSLVIMVVSGVVIYGAVLWIFQRPLIKEIWALVRARKSQSPERSAA